MKFSIKDFFSKCDQTRGKLQICSHLLKKSSMENFILGAVYDGDFLQKNYLQKDPLYVNLSGFEYIYLLKVNNRNTRIRWEICSKLTRDSLVSLLLTLNIFHTLFIPCLGLKKRLLFDKILRKGVRKAAISLFIKVETHAQVFSCEFCKIFRNTSGRMLEY